MTSRIPYEDIPRYQDVPYVRRAALHASLDRWSRNRQSGVLFGEQPQAGVTNTLYHFVQEATRSRFADGTRECAVFDLNPHAYLRLPEILVLVRNIIVETIDKAGPHVNYEHNFFAFDVAWAVWSELFYRGQHQFIKVRSSKYRRLGARLGKRIFTVGVGGIFEAIEIFGHLVGLAGQVANVSTAASGEVGSEAFLDHQAEKLGRFLMLSVGPRLSARFRALIDPKNCRPEQIAVAMIPLLVDAVECVQKELGTKKILSIAIDSIDELLDQDLELIKLRFAVCQVLTSGVNGRRPTILAGREPSDIWKRELQDIEYNVEAVGPLTAAEIRAEWTRAKVDNDYIDDVIKLALAGTNSTFAGNLARTWRRYVERVARQVAE